MGGLAKKLLGKPWVFISYLRWIEERMTFEQWIQAVSREASLLGDETPTALSKVYEPPEEDYGDEEDL